jgi:hypothetical protein
MPSQAMQDVIDTLREATEQTGDFLRIRVR